MPGMTGSELAAQIRAINTDVPIVLMSRLCGRDAPRCVPSSRRALRSQQNLSLRTASHVRSMPALHQPRLSVAGAVARFQVNRAARAGNLPVAIPSGSLKPESQAFRLRPGKRSHFHDQHDLANGLWPARNGARCRGLHDDRRRYRYDARSKSSSQFQLDERQRCMSGSMTAKLADGEAFTGKFFQITTDTRVDRLESLCG